jgi:hypothetical protein
VSAEHPDVAAKMDAFMDGWLDAQHAGRADPMDEVIDFGLPAVRRLDAFVEEESKNAPDQAAAGSPMIQVALERAMEPANEQAIESESVSMSQSAR